MTNSHIEKFTRDGITIRRRNGTAKYNTRVRFRGKVHWLTLAETVNESFTLAIRGRREIQAGRWQQLKDAVQMRAPVAETTVAQLTAAYAEFQGHDRPADSTRRQNIQALEQIIRETFPRPVGRGEGQGEGSKLPLSILNAQFVWTWRDLKQQAAAQEPTAERRVQFLRSANSRLRQARSVLSAKPDLRTFYRLKGVTLPDCVDKFLAEPGFAQVSKDEYHAPNDTIIVKTFAALEQLAKDDLNAYKAVWLAIGFGFRKGEVSAAKNGWFINVNGAVFARGDELAKNKKFPEVMCQLGAWSHLAPHIAGQPADAYMLQGNATERCEDTFRRISAWMKALGWQTTHHLHEFRAWSGSQLAMQFSLRAAQIFLRHASYATTEKFYGHHMRIKMEEAQLQLPTLPEPFSPVVLPAV